MNSLHTFIHHFHNPDKGILFVRLALAAVFIHAGWLKLTSMDMVVPMFATLGIPAALAYVVAYGEFICGVAVLLGIFVRYAGMILAVVMVVAIAKVHGSNGFGLQNGGYEYVLVLLLCSLAMVTFGAGRYSLAQMLKKK